MRLRSTGLGKTELVGNISQLSGVGDYLVMDVHVIEPTNWRIKAGLTGSDIIKLAVLLLKPKTILFIISHLFKAKKPTTPLEM